MLLLLSSLVFGGTEWPEEWDITWDTTDLHRIESVIGEAEVLGLGEHVHTSGGVTEAKALLTAWLVREHNFRIIAFESPWQQAELAAAYVRTCKGSATTAAAGLFGVFQDVSVVELLEELCVWNQSHPGDVVELIGFDVQEPLLDGVAVRAAYGASLPSCAVGVVVRWPVHLALDCIEDLSALEPSPDAKTRLAVQSWTTWHKMQAANTRLSTILRDRGLATQLLDQIAVKKSPSRRVIVWSHNYHIAKEVPWWSHRAKVPLGAHLKEALGDNWRAVGFSAVVTGVHGPGFGPPPAQPGERRAVDHSTLAVALLAEDSWWRRPRVIGDLILRPAKAWDALVVLRHSRPMFPMAWLREADDPRTTCFLGEDYAWWDLDRLRALAERALRVSGHEEQTDHTWIKDGVTWRANYTATVDPARWCVQMWRAHNTPGSGGG